ncbi:CinA family protein [Planctomicrobium sp. SH664]|uniref:CinA family protein n=1 Tax=Planctomicrobium sp. SH664 TaxID=3448125 RepID=UPI003F5B90A8
MSVVDGRLWTAVNVLARELKARQLKLVLAESCTGGTIAAALTDIPGSSDFFCGSSVTYRNETKAEWLGIARSDLENPNIGPVSPRVAEQMCKLVLQKTPEADIAASVTGHVGPGAPDGLDGVIYIGVVTRASNVPVVQRRTLSVAETPDQPLRLVRRYLAATMVIEAVLQHLAKQSVDLRVK